ncbi:hypothetical protein SEA_LYSIDIOUS_49 [Gordonia phage Lysidious]|nr:hypothetical protein SEA_LYSIDIOUS_49 [Gordonia phage Lysidious]
MSATEIVRSIRDQYPDADIVVVTGDGKVSASSATLNRDTDEELGRSRRVLAQKCIDMEVDLATVQPSIRGRTTCRVMISNPRNGAHISAVHSTELAAVDAAYARLSREDWDL